jgi:transketolase
MAEAVSLREAFGQSLVALGRRRQDFVVLDADVAGGTCTKYFKEAFPARFYDFGIAEQNMMAAAAGFASVGVTPVVTTFSVFASLRALEQLRTFIAYPNFGVKVVGSHCGIDAGPDGATAQAIEDLAVCRAIPNLAVVVPADPIEMDQAVTAILDYPGPVYMRSGRSPVPVLFDGAHDFALGRGEIVHAGTDLTIIATGIMVHRALAAAITLAAWGRDTRVGNLATLKPLDDELVLRCARETGALVTAEDHSVIGGLGGAVAELTSRHLPVPLEIVGVPDCFGESGEPELLATEFGLGAPSLVAAALRVAARKGSQRVARCA